uniref:Uncharacterized protein n=1 Tax=Schistocephalus solidus TaxID=70667 RepID=A0A0X3NSI7_SCHSO
MSDQDSEFIVVDDNYHHKINENIKRLKEVIDMYERAHGALVKSNILLQDKLHLALQLVLQRLPPDTESNIEELVKSASQSVYACSDAVRRDYVKSLCSKLVIVNAEYQKLAQEFEAYKLDGVSDNWFKPNIERLRTVLQDMETMLLSPDGTARSPITVTALEQLSRPAGDDLSELCALAERINLRIKAQLDAKSRVEHCEIGCDPISLSTGETSSSRPETQAAGMHQQAIVKVIQEEVSSVMQKEMQKALEAHRDLIRATMAVETTATSVIVPASGLPSADPDARQSSSGNSTFPRAMAASSVKPEVPVPGYEAVSKTAATATPPPPPPPTEPTFTPEQVRIQN